MSEIKVKDSHELRKHSTSIIPKIIGLSSATVATAVDTKYIVDLSKLEDNIGDFGNISYFKNLGSGYFPWPHIGPKPVIVDPNYCKIGTICVDPYPGFPRLDYFQSALHHMNQFRINIPFLGELPVASLILSLVSIYSSYKVGSWLTDRQIKNYSKIQDYGKIISPYSKSFSRKVRHFVKNIT